MLRARIGEYGTEAVLEGNYEPYTPASQPVTKNGFLELMMENQP